MEIDFQEDFEPSETLLEPEWVQLNRQWTLDHPSILFDKCPFSFLDSWVTCDSPSNDFFFPSQEVKKKCFIDKIDIRELVNESESFNIDNLFAETECSSCEARVKRWEAKDEAEVIRLISSQGANNMEMWKKIAEEVGRSVNSVRIKAGQLKKGLRARKVTVFELISKALELLTGKQGSKQEIIEKIEDMQVGAKPKQWKSTVKQLLGTYFAKVPGVYKLVEGCLVPEFAKVDTMKGFILWVLQKYQRLNRNEIKAKIFEHFERWLNVKTGKGKLKIWEITLLKKLKNCDGIDYTEAKTTFRARKPVLS